jgi:hypothetical protein
MPALPGAARDGIAAISAQNQSTRSGHRARRYQLDSLGHHRDSGGRPASSKFRVQSSKFKVQSSKFKVQLRWRVAQSKWAAARLNDGGHIVGRMTGVS